MTAASNTQGITLLAYNKRVSGSLTFGSLAQMLVTLGLQISAKRYAHFQSEIINS